MPHKRLIPAMLLSDGRLVKGRRFADHEDAGNPVTTAKIYNDQMADEILVLDIAATPRRRPSDLDTLRAMAARCFVPIAFGGGIATADDARAALRAGADKIVVNSAALHEVGVLSAMAEQFGRQAVVAAIDWLQTAAGPRVAAECGRHATDRDPVQWARSVAAAGAGEILLTSVDREGGRGGPDVELCRRVASAVDVPVIAQGGVGRLEDFVAAIVDGTAAAVAAGRSFQFADNNLIKVRRFMIGQGVDLRPS
jgi:cyclase